ncbi:MAG: alkyl hydroperoxide reductase AhpD [Candidatus Poribacteria bacterium]|nr:MAG: alkyl hydroperoxide reductase AhpD [Candidatus Poribacteria bacterium]
MTPVPSGEDGAISERVQAVFDDIKATRKIERVPAIWRALAAYPELLEASWDRVKRIMADGSLDRKTKEMIALAVSITNGCSYCINSHTAALQRLGATRREVEELLAVVGLFNEMNRLADALQVEPDVRPEPWD